MNRLPPTASATGSEIALEERPESARPLLALLIAWSAAEPGRVGDVALLAPGASAVLGRGDGWPGSGGGDASRLVFVRQRPGVNAGTLPLGGIGLSREALRVESTGEAIVARRVGKRPLELRGVEVDRCTLRPGDALHVRGQLVLLCSLRPPKIAPLRHFPASALGAFGQADSFGMVGESPQAYRLRDRLAFAAQASGHTLLEGESGTGKELAAAAIHGLSPRRSGPWVARNAATLPPSLVDAELFGNARNYPNAGMPERVGLVGEAHGGTLFLDEIAELPAELQSHLLRVLDARGEYQRLGESTSRRADFALVGATNRERTTLKHDLLARFPLAVDLPPLRERRDDLPLLVRAVLARAAARSPAVAERFVSRGDHGADPRLDPRLMLHLLGQPFAANVRELEAILWRAMAESPSDTLTLPATAPAWPPVAAGEEGRGEPAPTAAAIRACLTEQDGNVTRAAAVLGLSSRFALYRLMKKLGIEAEGAAGQVSARAFLA